MSLDLQQELIAAASSTFEQFGFVFADLELSEEQEAATIDTVARVEFHGPVSGVVELRLAGDILAEIAGNMVGNFDDLGPELLKDAAGELANVVCGNVLPSIGGTEAVFDLRAPEVSLGSEIEVTNTYSSFAQIGLEAGRAEIALTIDENSEIGTEA